MYEIITFGSAAQDIHIKSKVFKTIDSQKDFGESFGGGRGICLPFGSKVNIEDIIFTTGGGGTNTAATFAKQGIRTAFCGAIGVDAPGLEIVRELKLLGIDTKFVVKKKEKHTNSSIIISNIDDSSLGSGKDRTILVYRGASDIFTQKDIPWTKIKKAKWFYLAPMTGLLCDTFEEIVNFAKINDIKVTANPSMDQLSLPVEKLNELFKKIDILFLNQEEASFLTKVPFEQVQDIFKKLDEMCPGITVMTRGAEGVIVSDGKYLYSARPDENRKIVDTTGAGDSFAAGFLTDYIRHGGDIEKAIQFGLANSAANLSEIGAKKGILEKDAEFEKMPVTKQPCSDNNLCITK